MINLRAGRILFGLPIGGIGVLHLCIRHFSASLFPDASTWFPSPGWAYLAGAWLTLAGIGLLMPSMASRAALLANVFFALIFLYPHLFRLIAKPTDAGEWTVLSEVLALGAAAWLLLVSLKSGTGARRVGGADASRPAAIILAICFIAFGVIHYLYAEFIATLIPAWMPARLALSYVVMMGFFLTALSLVINRATGLAGILFAAMFGIMVLCLHVPRVVASPNLEAEWCSMLIALGMCATGLIIAAINRTPGRLAGGPPGELAG